MAQEIKQVGDLTRVQTGRSTDSFVDLNPQQFKSFQSTLQSSFESGKNQSFKRSDALVRRAISFGFSESQARSFQGAVDRLERQRQQTIAPSERAKISRDLRLSQAQLRQLQATDRGGQLRTTGRTTASERQLQQSLPSNLRNQSLNQLKLLGVSSGNLSRVDSSLQSLPRQEANKFINSLKSFSQKAQNISRSFTTPEKQKEFLANNNITFTQRQLDNLNKKNQREQFNELFDKFVDNNLAKLNLPFGITEEKFEFDPSALALAVAFDPLISVGVASKVKVKVSATTKQQSQVTSGVKFDKLDLDNVATGLRNEFIKGDKTNLNKLIRETLLKGNKKQIKFVKRLIQDSIGKKNTNNAFKDIIQQEGLDLAKNPRVRIGVGQIDTPATTSGSGGIPSVANIRGEVPASTQAPQGAEREFQPSLSAFNRNQADVQRNLARNQFRVELAQQPINQRLEFMQSERGKQLLKQSNLQISKTGQLSAQALRQKELTKQAQQLQQVLRSQQLFRQSSRFAQLSAQKKAQALKQQFQQRFRLQQRFRIRLKQVPKVPFAFPLKKKSAQVFKKVKTTIKKGKLDVFVFKNKKAKKIGSFTKEKIARRVLKKRLETTLRASGFIKNKNTGKRLVPKITKGFRRSKTKKNVLVELKNKRLDHINEVRKIQSKRKIKKQQKAFKKRIK